jgi:hypothetical protein
MAAHEGPQLAVSDTPVALPKLDEAQEYEKILSISDEIFSGAHPRLKVPQQFVRKVLPRTFQNSVVTNAQITMVEAPESKAQQPNPSTPRPTNTQSASSTNPTSGGRSAGGPSRVAPNLSSEIDPIFLTKSDGLVRAEIQLQRQRVERALREQVDQRRLEARQRPSTQEAKPDFDVSDVLIKALRIVMPMPSIDVHKANGTTPPSDSFDENSFYSSQAPDSPQRVDIEDASLDSERQVHPVDTDDLAIDVPGNRCSDELQRLEAANTDLMDIDVQESIADKHLPSQTQQPSNSSVHATPSEKYPSMRDPDDTFDEPEYSPPEPDMPAIGRRDSREYRGEIFGQRRRANDKLADRRYIGRRLLSPPADVRVIRNHITSPAAPQPSRVSPLAVAKVASVQQPRYAQPDDVERIPTGQDSERTSPEHPAELHMQRKRRRLRSRPRTRSRRIPPHRQPMDSPEPFIKDEPVSPPPFVDIPSATPGRSRQPQERAVYIDLPSPRYTPAMDRRDQPIREPAYELDRYGTIRDYDAPIEANITRTVSRLDSRKPTQDLRRVASLHHARLPETSREYREPATGVNPRPVRAVSYAVIERPVHERARYYDEVVPSYTRRYAPVGELPPSPGFHETYLDEETSPRLLGPTQRRIVVDEHGNHYEAVSAPKVQPMPPPPSRVAKTDSYNERVHLRNAGIRANSIIEDPYGDRRYIQEMPPPVYRRVVDYPRGALDDRRPYPRQFEEREPIIRSSSAVLDFPPRHATYIEEREVSRERLLRMPSSRPPPSRYDDARDVQRVQSVRPGGREVSVYVDNEDRHSREYVERPVYASSRPLREDGFFEDDDPSGMILDGAREVVQRIPQPY